MPKTHNIAAIDAGSNGIRVVIGKVDHDDELSVVTSNRDAVRMGSDSFGTGRLREETIRNAVESFRGIRKLLCKYDVTIMRAVATSAARDAENGEELVEAIYKETGIELEIIDGLEEAQLIFTAVSSGIVQTRKTSLLIDMGGGSVEATVARNGRALGCETLPLGPVRLLQQIQARGLREHDVPVLAGEHIGDIAGLVRAELGRSRPQVSVGSGGNLVRLGKLRKQLLNLERTDIIIRAELDEIITRLLKMSVKQRIKELGVRPDRADVIAIAALVMRMVLDDADVDTVQVPGVSLKEGLLMQVAKQVRAAAKR